MPESARNTRAIDALERAVAELETVLDWGMHQPASVPQKPCEACRLIEDAQRLLGDVKEFLAPRIDGE